MPVAPVQEGTFLTTDVDWPVCRLCFQNEEELPGEPLFTPCKCRGSALYIHECCLREWRENALDVEQRDFCPTCQYKYATVSNVPSTCTVLGRRLLGSDAFQGFFSAVWCECCVIPAALSLVLGARWYLSKNHSLQKMTTLFKRMMGIVAVPLLVKWTLTYLGSCFDPLQLRIRTAVPLAVTTAAMVLQPIIPMSAASHWFWAEMFSNSTVCLLSFGHWPMVIAVHRALYMRPWCAQLSHMLYPVTWPRVLPYTSHTV